jgi:hypothetical protein
MACLVSSMFSSDVAVTSASLMQWRSSLRSNVTVSPARATSVQSISTLSRSAARAAFSAGLKSCIASRSLLLCVEQKKARARRACGGKLEIAQV